MTEEDLKAKITEMEKDLDAKEQQIDALLDRIEELEDTILNFQNLINNEASKNSEKKWKKAKDSMLEMELGNKEKEIRDLKDRMGFLRRDYIQLQHEYEKCTKKESSSTVIRIEEDKQPFETLVKDLQNKINKQQIVISELEEKIKKTGVESLNAELMELRQKLEIIASPGEIQEIDKIYNASLEQLRKKLIQSNKRIKSLEKQLEKYKKMSNKLEPKEGELKIQEPGETINNLIKELKIKDEKILELFKQISGLKAPQDPAISDKEPISTKAPPLNLTEELQRKLNKAKIEIKDLKKQLEDYKIWKAPTDGNNQDEIVRELRSKLERISAQDHIVDNLRKISNQNPPSDNEDPHLLLRIKELQNLIEELKTQNIQQRLEISKLRKK